MRHSGSLVATIGMIAVLWMALPAQAQATSADLAMVRHFALDRSGSSVTSASAGSVIRFVFIAKDLGPDPIADGDSFDTSYGSPGFIRNATFKAEVCAFGVSPDTPSCEVGPVAVGVTVKTVVKVAVGDEVGQYARVRVCAFAENGTPDPDRSNDCATTKVLITS